jgi:transcriptional regulator with XRE-family HTH domain
MSSKKFEAKFTGELKNRVIDIMEDFKNTYKNEKSGKVSRKKWQSSEEDLCYFAERLKACVGDNSLRAFASKAGISPTALRQYLIGKSEPTRSMLLAIARTAGVNVAWLATGDGPMRTAGHSPEEPPRIFTRDVKTAEMIAESGNDYASREGAINSDLLTEAAIMLEQELALVHKVLPPDKKGEVIALLYELLREGPEHNQRQKLKRILRLVS